MNANEWIIFNDTEIFSLTQKPTSRWAWIFFISSRQGWFTAKQKGPDFHRGNVPETGFEPAHPFGRRHLNPDVYSRDTNFA